MDDIDDLKYLLNIVSRKTNEQKNDRDEVCLYILKELFITEAKEYINNTKDGLFISGELLFKDCIWDNIAPQTYDVEKKLLTIFSTNINKIIASIYSSYGITII